MIGVFVPREVSFKLGQDAERRRINEIVEERIQHWRQMAAGDHGELAPHECQSAAVRINEDCEILTAIDQPAERCPTTDASASEQSGLVSRVAFAGSADAQQDAVWRVFRDVDAKVAQAQIALSGASEYIHQLEAALAARPQEPNDE